MNLEFPSRHISLCGIKHAGKTTVASALASMTGRPASDTDDALAAAYADQYNTVLSVREIYKTLAEDRFRRMEAEVLRSVCRTSTPLILALGGGTLSNPYVTEDDRKQLGFLCWIDIPDEIAFQRIQKDGLPPFLQTEKDPFAVFCKQNQTRRAYYRKFAVLTVHPVEKHFSPLETAHYILTRFKEILP